jgi:hypothetical protein
VITGARTSVDVARHAFRLDDSARDARSLGAVGIIGVWRAPTDHGQQSVAAQRAHSEGMTVLGGARLPNSGQTTSGRKMSAYGSALSPEDSARGDALVADEVSLWSQFIHEMSRFGVVADGESGGLVFVAAGESAARMFLITPAQLRGVLVAAQANELRRDHYATFMDHLPQWLIDDLWETIGSDEEPYDEPYVILADDGRLMRSASRGHWSELR